MPRIFIISSHGSMSMQEDKSTSSLHVFGKAKLKKVVEFKSPVDIFTTASFGCSFLSDLRCDEPFVYFVSEIAMKTQSMKTQPTKQTLRKTIEDALLHTRSLPQHADVMSQSENKIRCHIKERPMTDLFLFGTNPALPVIESVTMFDVETGEIKDVHGAFGLVEKKKVAATPTMHPLLPEELAILQVAKMSAKSELAALKAARVDPHFIAMKTCRIKSIDDTIARMHKESKFEYSAKMKKKYPGRIKLSDLLRNGITGGLIDPDNDFVVVYACRVPDDGLLGAQTSPRNSSDSEGSVGGTKRSKHRARSKTCKRRRNSCNKYSCNNK